MQRRAYVEGMLHQEAAHKWAGLPMGRVSRHCIEVDFPPAPLCGSSPGLGALAQAFWICPFLGECFPHDADLSVNHTWVWKLTVFSNHWIQDHGSQRKIKKSKGEKTRTYCFYTFIYSSRIKGYIPHATLAQPPHSQFFPCWNRDIFPWPPDRTCCFQAHLSWRTAC